MTELQKLREKYKDIINNPEIRKIAFSRQKNTDNPVNEEKYLEKLKETTNIFKDLFKKTKDIN